MKEKVINALIKILIDQLNPQLIKKVFKDALYELEEKIEETETKYDDKIIIPVLQMLHDIID